MPTTRTYSTFGEYLFWTYANLQMVHYAVSARKLKYDQTCYMIRSKAFKAYKEERWNIHDLLEYRMDKILKDDHCLSCEKEITSKTKDGVRTNL